MSNMKHLFKQMVFLTLLLTFPLLEIHAQITVDMKNKPVSEVVKQIEKVSKYRFFYKKGLSGMNTPITVEANDQSIDAVMGQVVKQIPVSYTVKGETQVVITESELQNGTVGKSKTVKGVVTDMNGEPVIGANIVQKGSTNGVISDLNGAFEINVSEGTVLQVSYIGYLSQEVKVGKRALMNITLKEDTQTLDEVVVVGYTTQKKGLLTGAISNMIVSEELKTLPVTSAGNMLAGKLAGVDVSTPNSVPGSTPSISIRTRSSWNNQDALFVIDGVVSSASDFNNLSINEIQDVTVLKDAASAAIYGSRSAGGVVVVTTKKGRTGRPTFNYSYGYSFDSRTKNQEFTSAYETFDMYNKINGNSGTASFWGQDELEFLKTVNGGYGYDHLDEVYRNPTTQIHNLNVDGGNERIHYFAASSYVKQTGIFDNLSYNKYNIRMNVTANITDDLEAFVGFSLVNTQQQTIDSEFGVEGTYQSLVSDNPGTPYYTDGGQLIGNGGSWNLMSRIDGSTGYNKNDYLKPQLTASLTYKIPVVKGLSAKVLYARNWSNQFTKRFLTQYDMVNTKLSGTNGHVISTKDEDVTGVYKATWPDKSSLKKEYNKGGSQQLNFQLNYDRTFGEHHVNAAFVTEWNESSGDGVYGLREHFPLYQTDQFWAASSARADTDGGGNSDWKNGRMSYIGQFSYSYANKYLASFSFREDGSMNFAPDQRWGFFPAGSVGWVLSEENFFNKTFVDYLKLRASVGLTGNDAVGGWQWQYSFKQGNSAYYGKTPSRLYGVKYGSVINPDLTWEKALSWNVGVDMNFATNWNVSADYWFKNSYDILGDRQATLPTTYSQSMPAENYGQIHAQGVDFSLGYRGQSKDFSYFGNLTLSYGWNEVIKKDYAENAKYVDIPVGKATSYITGWVYDGIIRTQEQLDQFKSAHPDYRIDGTPPALGQMIYKDISGPDGTPDGIIDSWDKVVLKDNNFPVVYGLNLGGSWKGLSLDIMFSGRLGEYKSFRDLAEGAEWHRMWKDWYTDSWSEDNPNATLPKRLPYSDGGKTYERDSEYWFKKMNFMRLKYLTVSYTLPKTFVAGAFGNVIDNLRFYCSGTNLFVLSNFKYYDPEISKGKVFPVTRSISFGVDVKF